MGRMEQHLRDRRTVAKRLQGHKMRQAERRIRRLCNKVGNVIFDQGGTRGIIRFHGSQPNRPVTG